MKLILVDPFVTRKSPSMRSIVDSLDVILDVFSEVEVHASECDWSHPKVHVNIIPQRFKRWVFHSADYNCRVNGLGIGRIPKKDEIVQVTGCLIPRADIRYMHFWNNALVEEAAKRPTFKLPPHKLLLAKIAARTEMRTVEKTDGTGAWWVVSRSIAEKIKEDASGSGEFQILPNVYDPERFNADVRSTWREKMREHYGFLPEEKVLVFSAFGHFERKGLLEAVEAVSILRKEGQPLRLLVLGGDQGTVSAFRKKVVSISDGVVFAGLVENMERHLSAADGLYFPSHFEAFSLAEIEAAAMGLRLYLTPHYGQEMILRDPVNGRLLPWDSAGMAKAIGEDLTLGRLGEFHTELGEAVDLPEYQNLLSGYYQDAVTRKQSALGKIPQS